MNGWELKWFISIGIGKTHRMKESVEKYNIWSSQWKYCFQRINSWTQRESPDDVLKKYSSQFAGWILMLPRWWWYYESRPQMLYLTSEFLAVSVVPLYLHSIISFHVSLKNMFGNSYRYWLVVRRTVVLHAHITINCSENGNTKCILVEFNSRFAVKRRLECERKWYVRNAFEANIECGSGHNMI